VPLKLGRRPPPDLGHGCQHDLVQVADHCMAERIASGLRQA